MGQLAASIAHEINQPITAAVTNANAGLLWLAAQPPNLDEVRDAFDRVIKASNQAAEVIGRIRVLIKRAPPPARMIWRSTKRSLRSLLFAMASW
jgi:C4-dicarboxylate-specific signal transduction histidine kinase